MCAVVAIKYNPDCKAFYNRLKESGKPSKVALIAVANKLIRQLYAILTKKETYVPNFCTQASWHLIQYVIKLCKHNFATLVLHATLYDLTEFNKPYEEIKIAEERQKAEKNREQDRIDTKNVVRNMGLSEEQIAEVCSQLDVMRQSRILQKQD